MPLTSFERQLLMSGGWATLSDGQRLSLLRDIIESLIVDAETPAWDDPRKKPRRVGGFASRSNSAISPNTDK